MNFRNYLNSRMNNGKMDYLQIKSLLGGAGESATIANVDIATKVSRSDVIAARGYGD